MRSNKDPTQPKINKFIFFKNPQTKKLHTDWQKILAVLTNDKGLVCRITNFNTEKHIHTYTNTQSFKWAKEMNRQFTKEETQMSTKYEKMLTLPHESSGKCILH